MEVQELSELLKSHHLRVTECRIETLRFLQESDGAVSSRTLEEQFPTYDRVTLYRTIQSFEEKGLIHSIPDSSGVARYAYCKDQCSPGHHQHSHIHFKCKNCGTIECINSTLVQTVNIPGYSIEGIETIATGVCSKCNEL